MHRCFSGLLLAAVAAISIDATDPAYEKQLLEWRKTRLAELTADDGWLTVVGLLWIHQGANHAGSASGMDLKMPSPAPQELGVFTLEGERVSFAAAQGRGPAGNGGRSGRDRQDCARAWTAPDAGDPSR
jgi:uncharacterized protein (DUF1684 family)